MVTSGSRAARIALGFAVPTASSARAFRQGASVLLNDPKDPNAVLMRSRVRYMDFENIWLAEPDGSWRPRPGAPLALQAESAGVRHAATVAFRERTEDPERLWRLDRPADDAIERSPARADLRQKVWISGAAIEVFAEIGEFRRGKRFPVTVVDLSAGGALLESAVEIPVGAELDHTLEFPLPHQQDNVQVDIRIIDSRAIRRFGSRRHRYRARLVRPGSGVTRQIARYVFEVDAAMRRQAGADQAHLEEPFPTPQALALLGKARDVSLEIPADRGAIRLVRAAVVQSGRRTLMVEAPTSPEGLAAIDPASRLTLVVHDPGTKVNVVGSTRRLGVVTGESIQWRLAVPTEFRQRLGRSHVRWPVVITDARVIAVDASVQPPSRVRRAVSIVNLSAGGAAFLSAAALPTGPRSGHSLTFTLPDADAKFSIRLHIVAVQRRRMRDRTVFVYRCQFRNLTEPERDEITRHIYRLQAEHRRDERDAAS